MKPKTVSIANIMLVTLIAAAIIFLPSFYFNLQERKILDTEKEVPVKALKLEKNAQAVLSLEQRRELAGAEKSGIERISLKTGDVYSLYEARKQCYRELLKLPVLKMDLYSPPQKEIDLTPSLLVDSENPAYSIIVWSGSLKINKIIYQVVLDEGSGKLLSIQPADEDSAEYKALREELKEQWKKYFYE